MSGFLRDRAQAYADNIGASIVMLGGSVFVGYLINSYSPNWGLDPKLAQVFAWSAALLVVVMISLLPGVRLDSWHWSVSNNSSKEPLILPSAASLMDLWILRLPLRHSQERRAQVSPRMVAHWKEQIPALSGFFKDSKLKSITTAHVTEYQDKLDAGKAPKTINGEISVLRHARLWYRFSEDYKPVSNNKPPVGRVLTEEEQSRLFEVAQSRTDWMIAHAAATLAFYCGMRACELRALKWEQVDLVANLLT